MKVLLIDLACLALVLAALWAAGDVLVRGLGSRWPQAAREFTSTVALGMGVWSLLLFGLAATRFLLRPVLLVLVAVALAWALWCALHFFAVRRSPPGREWTWIAWLAALPAATVAFAALEIASFPTLGWDDAAYHLRLPALYLARGGFAAPRFSFYAHWPQNMEMLYALALALRGPALAKLLHASCGILLGVAAYRLARRVAPPAAALSAPLLVAASPLALEVARFAYVDLALTLFVLLAFDAVLRAGESDAPRRHLILAGSWLGLAAGVKLTAWSAAAALLVLWTAHLVRRRDWRRLLLPHAAALLLPALLLALPWHLKSWLETGNPVYPLLYRIFDGADWSADLATRAAAWQRGIGMGRSPGDYLLLPLRVFAMGGKGYDRFDGALGPYWLVVSAFAVWAGWRHRVARWALAAAATFFALWAAGPQQARFLLPVLPLLAVAAAAAAGDLSRRRDWRWAPSAFTFVATCIAAWSLLGPMRDAGSQMALRRQAGPNLEARLLPPALSYLEQETPPSAKVLFLNNNRVYPLTREVVADSTFEASQIADWLRPLRSATEVGETLRNEGITHVLVERVDWGIAWPRPLLDLLADPRYARQVFASPDGRFAVYALAAR